MRPNGESGKLKNKTNDCRQTRKKAVANQWAQELLWPLLSVIQTTPESSSGVAWRSFRNCQNGSNVNSEAIGSGWGAWDIKWGITRFFPRVIQVMFACLRDFTRCCSIAEQKQWIKSLHQNGVTVLNQRALVLLWLPSAAPSPDGQRS